MIGPKRTLPNSKRDDYGSEGWGFESLRARQVRPRFPPGPSLCSNTMRQGARPAVPPCHTSRMSPHRSCRRRGSFPEATAHRRNHRPVLADALRRFRLRIRLGRNRPPHCGRGQPPTIIAAAVIVGMVSALAGNAFCWATGSASRLWARPSSSPPRSASGWSPGSFLNRHYSDRPPSPCWCWASCS